MRVPVQSARIVAREAGAIVEDKEVAVAGHGHYYGVDCWDFSRSTTKCLRL